jgi:hypothetical protein
MYVLDVARSVVSKKEATNYVSLLGVQKNATGGLFWAKQ